ncbi:MAG TPA: hypothetical protein VK540_03780 [Polyangiaceae bacterium]|nr:hypothetical protein [Polyangiaceae bacterium]
MPAGDDFQAPALDVLGGVEISDPADGLVVERDDDGGGALAR